MRHQLCAGLAFCLCLANWALAQDQAARLKVAWKTPVEYGAVLAGSEASLFSGPVQLDARTGKAIRRFVFSSRGNEIKAIHLTGQTIVFLSESNANEEEQNRSFDYFWNAFDLKSGQELWTALQNCPRPSGALLETCGRLVLLVKGEAHDQVVAVEARSGKTVWSQKQSPVLSLAAAEGRVYLQTAENALALGADDGEVLWQTRLPGEAGQRLVLGAGKVIVSRRLHEDIDRVLLVLDQKSGTLTWKKEFPKTDLFPAAVGAGKIFLVAQPETGSGCLLALEAKDGKETWRQEAVADYNGHDFQPVVHGQQVLFWTGDPVYLQQNLSSGRIRLKCLNLIDGKTAWTYVPSEKEKVIYSQVVFCGEEMVYQDEEDVVGMKVDTKGVSRNIRK
jgi:outer membrane protein assembly factor BamB